jgi:hypothetical protein
LGWLVRATGQERQWIGMVINLFVIVNDARQGGVALKDY